MMAPVVTYKMYNEQLRIPEQEQAEGLLMFHKKFILGFEPGKGKSYPVIHCILEVQKLKSRNIKVLIMSDATCIKEMWKTEIIPQRVLPAETYFVTDRTAIGDVKVALLKTDWDIIVVDECQSLRSGVTRKKSQYAKLVYALTKKAEYVWGMTGTLSGNNNIEPWCILHNLNIARQGDINPYTFKKECCVLEMGYGPFGNFMRPVRLNLKGEKILEIAYQNGVMFWGYDDNDEMPPLEVTTRTFKVESTPEYELALEGILKLADYESTTIKAIAMQKAQQALNGFMYYVEVGERKVYRLSSYDNPKLKYVVEESIKEKTIIGYRFQDDEAALSHILSVNKIKWTTSITDFKNEDYQVLLLQCSKGKSANIQVCRNIIYYTADFSFISFKQFIHRTWRRGQTEPCKVTFLINDPGDRHQVERKIWESLQNKQNIHNLLMAIKRVDDI